MVPELVFKSIANGKARFLCAVAGIAAAAGAVVFAFSLAASNDAQAPAIARSLAAPWKAWKVDGMPVAGMRQGMRGDGRIPGRKERGRKSPRPDLSFDLVATTIDYRPGGRVMQGPPLRAAMASSLAGNPYANASLEGRWPDGKSPECEVVLVRAAMKRFGRGTLPAIGDSLKFVGTKGTMTAKITGYLDCEKLPAGFPGAFANPCAFALFEKEPRGKIDFWKEVPPGDDESVLTPEKAAWQFKTDAGRNMDRAKPLMLWAAALTALCLLVNSLLLSLEARRKELAGLRLAGLTRGGVVGAVFFEALLSSFSGAAIGILAAIAALAVYVKADASTFPLGMAVSGKAVFSVLAGTAAVSAVALSLVAAKAFRVRPLDVAGAPVSPGKRRLGMAIAFGCGFGAFVAVEVWGASLMKPFVPSPQWPDAIVSLLPGGATSFDIEKLRNLPGVARVSELQAMQLEFIPAEPARKGNAGGRPQNRNALVLASQWLPDFRFVSSCREDALKAMKEDGACVITEMMARARKLKTGDVLTIGSRGVATPLKIAGIVDLNWHLVTSRGLLRGMNRMPVDTDGPVFVTFDTFEAIDPRPAPMVRMTHVWLDYEKAFLSEHGVFPAGRKVEESVRKALGDSPDFTVRLHSRDEIAHGTIAHGAKLIGSMARVPFVFLVVLSVGFVALLVAAADASKKEFRTLKAVGATKAQLARRIFAEAVRPAVRGILAGTPAGALAGWLFTAGTRAAMSHWGLPPSFAVPWGVVAAGAAGAFVFMAAVSLPVSFRLVLSKRKESR